MQDDIFKMIVWRWEFKNENVKLKCSRLDFQNESCKMRVSKW